MTTNTPEELPDPNSTPNHYDPAPPEPVDDPLIDSVFMKVSRAVDGDDHFKNRVEMALEILGYPAVRKNLIHVANLVADSITCTVSGTVDTTAVTDTQISEAIQTAPVTEPVY